MLGCKVDANTDDSPILRGYRHEAELVLTIMNGCRYYLWRGCHILKHFIASSRGKTNLKRYAFSLCVSILLFPVLGLQSPLSAQDDISVRRDEDKTVYTIDSEDENKQLQERERERAWDMLRNMPVIIDGRKGQPVPVQPGPVQPVPLAPGK